MAARGFTMANRVVDYERSQSDPSRSVSAKSSFTSADLKKYMGSVEELILKYPGPALASAFMVGVLVAWWIKRR